MRSRRDMSVSLPRWRNARASAQGARLTRLATEVKSWTPARPDDQRRRCAGRGERVVHDLRAAILAAKPFLL
jgi:hypothetical protein